MTLVVPTTVTRVSSKGPIAPSPLGVVENALRFKLLLELNLLLLLLEGLVDVKEWSLPLEGVVAGVGVGGSIGGGDALELCFAAHELQSRNVVHNQRGHVKDYQSLTILMVGGEALHIFDRKKLLRNANVGTRISIEQPEAAAENLLKKKFAGKNLRHGRVLVVADGQLLDVNWEVTGERG